MSSLVEEGKVYQEACNFTTAKLEKLLEDLVVTKVKNTLVIGTGKSGAIDYVVGTRLVAKEFYGTVLTEQEKADIRAEVVLEAKSWKEGMYIITENGIKYNGK